MNILECCRTMPGAWFEICIYYIDDDGTLQIDEDYTFAGTLEELEEFHFDNWAKYGHNSPFESSCEVKPSDFNIRGEGADIVCNLQILMDDIEWNIIELPTNSKFL